MTEWFEDWFNTEEYLNVYRHRNEEDAKNLFDLIIKNVPLEKGSKVLDLACGAGRHSILFAKNNFDVTAVDISDNLLNVGRKTAEELKLKINFINSDLRKLNLNEKFHLIINLFTSFGYFETDDENGEVIKMASQHLVDDGYFVLDFFNIIYLQNNLIPISYDKIEDGIIKQERVIEGDRLVKTIFITRKGIEKNITNRVRIFTKQELISFFKDSGLKIQFIYGDYLGNNFAEETSPRIIIIAKK
ncbi:MAG: class I SAM-dependent methyltransferase [Ignavibacteriales bacterium]|nr:class I SAM-dependent methyltransferase [Ignavibacteriales bacterium]